MQDGPFRSRQAPALLGLQPFPATNLNLLSGTAHEMEGQEFSRGHSLLLAPGPLLCFCPAPSRGQDGRRVNPTTLQRWG